MAFELTVLGSAGSHPGVGRLCSGHLVRAAADPATHLLLDAGNGSTANLQRLVPLTGLDAVVVSHGHVDHCVDLVGVSYALRFDAAVVASGRRLPVIAAEGVEATLRAVSSREDGTSGLDEVYAFDTVGDGDVRRVGGLTLTFATAIHTVPAVSVRVDDGEAVLVYSGDSAGGESLVRLARGADLLLCEATWTGEAADHPAGMHLTAGGAGAIAREAGVGRLVLTHLAGASDPARALAEARAVFDGPVELAEDLATYAVAPSERGGGPRRRP
jgi:ribonuclease BN (tRNA processing enzyme)